MKRLGILAVLALLFAINSSCDTASVNSENYSTKLWEVYYYESKNPTSFLEANGKYSENFWGDKVNVSCEITNDAKLAIYKDVVLKINFYSKTNSLVNSIEKTIYEKFPPSSKRIVNIQIPKYKDVNSLGWYVINASSEF